MTDVILAIIEQCKSHAEFALTNHHPMQPIPVPSQVFLELLELLEDRQRVMQDIYRISNAVESIKTRLEG